MADQTFDWDTMREEIMTLIPGQLTHAEWRALDEKVQSALRKHVGALFGGSTIEIRKTRTDKAEIRLWMSIGKDCVDFQCGFDLETIVSQAYSVEALESARNAIDARITAMRAEEAQ